MKATVTIASLVGIILLAGVPMYDTAACIGDAGTGLFCECINPFENLGGQAFRGDPDNLCGSDGPGICYVEDNCACDDQRATASRHRKQSALACQSHPGSDPAVVPNILQKLP